MVEKDELIKLVWPDTTVEENNLNQTISALRKALGEKPAQHRYIVTVPGRGYRLVAQINRGFGPVYSKSELPVDTQATTNGKTSQTPRRRRIVLAACIATSLIASGLAITYLAVHRLMSADRDARHPTIHSLAVLPLENLSHDASEDYFADGMTDELITELAQIGALRVISRTSAMQYKGLHKSLPQIAHELNVDAVIEGTVLRSGDRVRITAQLVRAATDQHLWAHSYEGDSNAVLTLQESVARDIAGEVRAELTPHERLALTNARSVNPSAYDAYLRGRYFADKRTAGDLAKAIAYFNEAIVDDPNSAQAYAGLAEVYSVLPEYESVPAHESQTRARAMAEKALQIDDSVAAAHAVLAGIAAIDQFDWSTSAREFGRAIELNPGSAVTRHFRALDFMCMGRWNEASAEMERARELDPLSVLINANVGLIHYYARQPDQAIDAERKALELGPNTAFIYEYLGMAYLQKGMYRESLGHLQKAVDLSHNFPLYVAELAFLYSAEGNRSQARRIVNRLESRSRQQYVSAYSLAVGSVALGDTSTAIARLEKSVDEREDQSGLIKIEPLFDVLHSDPRFQELVRRIGL